MGSTAERDLSPLVKAAKQVPKWFSKPRKDEVMSTTSLMISVDPTFTAADGDRSISS